MPVENILNNLENELFNLTNKIKTKVSNNAQLLNEAAQ
jgi:hypothetical protein